MLKYITKKFLKMFLSILFDLTKPLPPLSEAEKINISELRTIFQKLPVIKSENAPPSERMWITNMNRLRELVLNSNPRKFLRWDIITETMFVVYAPYISKELKFLKSLPDWKARWRNAIKESFVGHPIPYIFYPSSSANLIHLAYHLAVFERKTKKKLEDMDLVFEFGGGYGAMCRLFYNLGFKGKYIIFDLPPFSALQRYYLKSLGLPVQSPNFFSNSKSAIFCVSDYGLLKEILTNSIKNINKIFIATWSISETSENIRSKILPLISEFEAFLIAYQKKFEEMDNQEFFAKWKETIRNIKFYNWEIRHLPGNYYLIGVKNDK